MDSETTLIALVNRQFLYELLARTYAEEPDATYMDILRAEHTRDELGLVAHETTESILAAYDAALDALDSAEDLTAIQHDYVRIFIGPGTLKADPWESVHLSDTRALFQQELLPIRDAYRDAGFLPARYPHVQDDFIGLELDFMAKLAGAAKQEWETGNHDTARERLAQSRSFLNDHLLLWVDSLARAIENGYGDGFYARATQLAALIAERDVDVLDALLAN
ncbi:MAG: molecular chaperone TorD family protein [Coriobacteriia bacterium]|nr:molecular chaperone TorD family protein [Coriobacteriia bacterium]